MTVTQPVLTTVDEEPAAAASSGGGGGSAEPADLSAMTEEEQIAYAMRMSMQDSAGGSTPQVGPLFNCHLHSSCIQPLYH